MSGDYMAKDVGHGMTLHVIGEAEEGVWCPACALPSASVYTVVFTVLGMVYNDTQRRFLCNDCRTELIWP